MRPGKNPTPRKTLDLRKLWRDLKEDPPGKISTVNGGADGLSPKVSGKKI